MTIEYTVDQDGLRIETFPKGLLDIQKTMDYFGRLQNDARIKPGAIEIVYFKDVTDFKISSLEIEDITISYQTLNDIHKVNKTVFVCETDLEYGIGRMLQTFHKIANPNYNVTVVRSENEIETVQVV